MKKSIKIRTFQPKFSKQFRTKQERKNALDDCMCVDFMVNKLENQITDLLKSVKDQRIKLRKEGFFV